MHNNGISIIIPTVDRSTSLGALLTSFEKQSILPQEIIIVHQGTDALEDLFSVYGSLPLRYIFQEHTSLTAARNRGVQESTGSIIGFLDDDIVLDPNYISSIHSFFEAHPHALGVQGLITNFEEGHAKKVGGKRNIYRLYNFFAKFFLLNNSSRKNKLLLSGRNQYASRVQKVTSCQWLSGIGNYRRVVFDTYEFDESLGGYALGEDKLFSYPIFKDHHQSLFIDPSIRCEHHHADGGRPEEKKFVEMKIWNTYYIWKTLLSDKGVLAYMAFWWANLGDLILVFFAVLSQKSRFSFWWHHVTGYTRLLFGRYEKK